MTHYIQLPNEYITQVYLTTQCTKLHITFGYLMAHNTHLLNEYMTHALECAATGIGSCSLYVLKAYSKICV
jgi:hypothetical protein